MALFKSIFLLSILLTINAQWYIKKNYRTKSMSYPNPGKRSLPDDDIDCSIPYSQVHPYKTAAWILMCNYETSSLASIENVSPIDSNTPTHILVEKRSLHVVPPYIRDRNYRFNRFSMKLLRRLMQNK